MGRKQLSIIAALIICIFLPHAALAELYGWIDENGVKHFSNVSPPEGVESFRHKSEIQSKATDAGVQKNTGQQNQPSAPAPSGEGVSGKSDQGDGIPQEENVTSDDDYIRRGGVNRHQKRKRHERREERREDRKNDNLDGGEKDQTKIQESGKKTKQDRHEKPVNRKPQHRKQGHRPKK